MTKNLVEITSKLLDEIWQEVISALEKNIKTDFINDQDIRYSIDAAINSNTKSYRYVLPTQILAKLADSTLDSKCLQVGRGGKGAFDARTIAHKVIVPFDQANEGVMGGSPEPYVNNPLRVPEISIENRNAQKNREDWDHLCKVVEAVELKGNESFTLAVFKQIMVEIYRRLSKTKVIYPIPKRVSLEQCMYLIEKYLEEHSGGDRLLALSSALFVIAGKKLNLYSAVRRANITASDHSTGLLADLECVYDNGEIAFAIEVKDRKLTVSQIRTKIPNFRAKKVAEIFFIAQAGIAEAEGNDIKNLIEKQFASGHNIYITDIFSLCKVVLSLVRESGRMDFIAEVGSQLNAYSEIIHRRAWASLLSSI